MEIQHNSVILHRTIIVVHLIVFSPFFLYFKTWSLIQQYKQNLMSQMESLMTINYTCHAKVLRWYIGTFIFTRLTFKWNTSELNKYDKKTLELQKKVCSFKTEQKKITGQFGKRYFLIIHLFSFIWQKNRDKFCIFW